MPERSFQWIVEHRLAACVNPAWSPSVEAELRRQRIDLVVNLAEQPDADLPITQLHLPVADFTAPTQEQLDAGVAAITRAIARGQRVAVHCGGGLGRTGTLLAAYFVDQGGEPTAAIERVRATRPGSVETHDQVAAVHEFATRRAPRLRGG